MVVLAKNLLWGLSLSFSGTFFWFVSFLFCFFSFFAFFVEFCSEAKKLSSFYTPHLSSLFSRCESHTQTREEALFVFPTTLFFHHETTALLFLYTKSLPEHKPTDIYKNTMAFAALSTVRVVASVSRRRRRRRFFSFGFFVLSLSLSRARMREPSSELITDTFSIHFEY